MNSAKTARGSQGRPLRLLHLMVFVGAVAVSCHVVPAFVGAGLRAMTLPSLTRRLYLINGVSFTLVLWSFILTAFTFFQRRPLLRAGRSYGTSAVFAAAISIAVFMFRHVVIVASNVAIDGRSQALGEFRGTLGWIFYTILSEAPGNMAAAIIAVWSLLALTRVGRRPAGSLEMVNFCFAVFCLFWGFLGVLMAEVPWSWSWLDQKMD